MFNYTKDVLAISCFAYLHVAVTLISKMTADDDNSTCVMRELSMSMYYAAARLNNYFIS